MSEDASKDPVNAAMMRPALDGKACDRCIHYRPYGAIMSDVLTWPYIFLTRYIRKYT